MVRVRKRISFSLIIVAVIVLIYLLGVLTGIVLFTVISNASEIDTVEEYRELTIQPGETLWQIASREFPGKHTGEMVWKIGDLNDLDPGNLRIGQVIKIPK